MAGERFYLLPHDFGYMGERGAIDEAAVKATVNHSIFDEGQ